MTTLIVSVTRLTLLIVRTATGGLAGMGGMSLLVVSTVARIRSCSLSTVVGLGRNLVKVVDRVNT